MNVLFWLSIGLDRRSPSEHLLADMVETLCHQGQTVHILQKDSGGDRAVLSGRIEKLGVATTRIAAAAMRQNRLAGRFLTDVKYVFSCGKWLKKQQFDCVFLQSSNVAGLQARLLRTAQRNVPIVFNVQDIFPQNAAYSGKLKRNGLAYRLLTSMQRYAYGAASTIITISQDMKEELVALGVPEEKIQVIYNWSYRDSVYLPEELDYSAVDAIMDRRKFNVVYAGNLGFMQNVEVLIQAAAQMKEEKEIVFHIIGEGAYRKKLEDLAQALHADNVQFHGMLAAEQAPAIYSAADVNVIPLRKNIYRTALPSKTATCLACGKPIIFAIGRESKFATEVSRQTGCPVVDSDDVVGLCEAIRSVKVGTVKCDTEGMFTERFLKTKNSQRYAELIAESVH